VTQFFGAEKARIERAQVAGPTDGAKAVAEIMPETLTNELYRFFRRRGESAGGTAAEDHEACIARSTAEVAASLIQQRERVLDACDTVIGDLVAVYCQCEGNTEQWDLGKAGGSSLQRG